MSPRPDAHAGARARPLPALTFLMSLLILAAIALVALRTPAKILTGLPEGPEVVGVRTLVHDRLRVESGELRFAPALLGDTGDADVALATEAERSLAPLRLRRPRDPRLLAARASLSLAARRPPQAERLYRQALDLAPTYGEARLGLGTTLALRAATEDDDDRARGLRLRAISQFAAVPKADPGYAVALYDRVLLLERVGRADEARLWANEYFARDPASAWAVALRRALDVAPR